MKRYGLLLAALVATASCNNDITGLEPPSNPATETFAASLGVDITTFSRTVDGVYYKDAVVGTGVEVITTSDSVRVTYSGYLKDGTLFDSGTNSKFIPAAVVQGFRSGLLGMKEGGRRKLVIPSELGYGSQTVRDPSTGNITIPRQSTLVFDVQLLKAYNPATPTT